MYYIIKTEKKEVIVFKEKHNQETAPMPWLFQWWLFPIYPGLWELLECPRHPALSREQGSGLPLAGQLSLEGIYWFRSEEQLRQQQVCHQCSSTSSVLLNVAVVFS